MYSDQVVWLKQQGVSDSVIQEMETSGRVRVVRPIYGAYVTPAPVVVVRPRGCPYGLRWYAGRCRPY